MTANAGGSPSGIGGIACSVDGSPVVRYVGANVAGSGERHRRASVSCNAYDNAVDANGTRGESQTQTWSLKIGAPTVMGVGFAKYVGLKCHVVKRRKTIPGHWVTRTRHGKKVKVRTPTRHRIVKVTKCHPKTKRVRVVARVPLRRHGKIVRHHGKVVYRKKIEHKRVAVTPHWKSKATEHVRHGHATTVSGWLGLSDGTALAGQPVQILTAPDNGLGQFAVAATATTAANGTWTADLPAGPSRIVEASYGGGATTEATTSGQVKVVVRSRIKLKSVTPTRVAWGQSVTIKGKLLGGYLPAGGVNVRLRIGIGDAKATYGVQEHVAGGGRFTTTYTFGAGEARIHRRYWFQIATLPSGNYPYAPSSSNRIYVNVGGHPPRPQAPPPPLTPAGDLIRTAVGARSDRVARRRVHLDVAGGANRVASGSYTQTMRIRSLTSEPQTPALGVGTLCGQWSATSFSPPICCSSWWWRCWFSVRSACRRWAGRLATDCGTSRRRSTASRTTIMTPRGYVETETDPSAGRRTLESEPAGFDLDAEESAEPGRRRDRAGDADRVA